MVFLNVPYCGMNRSKEFPAQSFEVFPSKPTSRSGLWNANRNIKIMIKYINVASKVSRMRNRADENVSIGTLLIFILDLGFVLRIPYLQGVKKRLPKTKRGGTAPQKPNLIPMTYGIGTYY